MKRTFRDRYAPLQLEPRRWLGAALPLFVVTVFLRSEEGPDHDLPTVSLAVGVVRTFLGPGINGRQEERKRCAEKPSWLKLKWGVPIAARSLDTHPAPATLPPGET